jgi:hypothetical protein
MSATKKTMTIGGREVNLTKKGLPNLRELTKVEKTIIAEILEKKGKLELEEKRKEIYKAFGL